MLGRTERFKGLFKCDRGGNEEFEKPKSPQPPYRARGGSGGWKQMGRHKGTASRASRGTDRAATSEEATGMARRQKELSCWPRALLEAEIHQVVE